MTTAERPTAPPQQDGSRIGRFLRRVLLLTGVAVLGVAMAVAIVPGLEEYLPVEAAVEALGSDYVAIAVVGLAAVALAALVVVVRRLGGVDEATPPPVEGVPSAAYPGERFDRSTADRRFGGLGRSGTVDRERLRSAAVRAVSHVENCQRSVAERRVAEGTWTDDPVAATFLAGDAGGSRAGGGSRGTGEHARRTAEAIVRLHEDGELAAERPEPAPDSPTPSETAPGPDRGVEAPRPARAALADASRADGGGVYGSVGDSPYRRGGETNAPGRGNGTTSSRRREDTTTSRRREDTTAEGTARDRDDGRDHDTDDGRGDDTDDGRGDDTDDGRGDDTDEPEEHPEEP